MKIKTLTPKIIKQNFCCCHFVLWQLAVVASISTIISATIIVTESKAQSYYHNQVQSNSSQYINRHKPIDPRIIEFRAIDDGIIIENTYNSQFQRQVNLGHTQYVTQRQKSINIPFENYPLQAAYLTRTLNSFLELANYKQADRLIIFTPIRNKTFKNTDLAFIARLIKKIKKQVSSPNLKIIVEQIEKQEQPLFHPTFNFTRLALTYKEILPMPCNKLSVDDSFGCSILNSFNQSVENKNDLLGPRKQNQ